MRPLRLPSIKRLLIRLNLDLDRVRSSIRPVDYVPVNDVHRMVIILEDRRFLCHYGLDYWSVLRDVWSLARLRKHGGFSTIEMQLVRTVTRQYERTLTRKLYEITLAHICNWHFTKLEMLEAYLNIAYFGSDFPVPLSFGESSNYELVANDIFGKSLTDISIEDAAQIAAYLVYPRPYIPNLRWQARVDARAAYGVKLYALRKKSLQQIETR